MAKNTTYVVRYYRETIGRRTFRDAAEAVAFAVEQQRNDRLVDVGQIESEIIDIKVIAGQSVKELKGAK